MAEANMYRDCATGKFVTQKHESLATMRPLTLFKYGIDL